MMLYKQYGELRERILIKRHLCSKNRMGISLVISAAPPNKRMHPTADTQAFINLGRAARRVMRGVMPPESGVSMR